jgi:hypothetical protein
LIYKPILIGVINFSPWLLCYLTPHCEYSAVDQ